LPRDIGTLDIYAKTGEIPKPVREALAKAISLKQQMEELRREVELKRQQIAQVTQDEARIRENIKVAPDKSALKNNNLEKLAEKDREIDDLFKAMNAAEKSFAAKQKELDEYVQNLNVE